MLQDLNTEMVGFWRLFIYSLQNIAVSVFSSNASGVGRWEIGGWHEPELPGL